MQALQAAGTPGEAHERLAETVGSWDMEIKMWMDPSAPPSVTTGTVERKMILGNRVLVEEVTSSMMGSTFTGYGMTGYDNVRGEYWGTWNDSMSTGISTSRGSYDAESNSYTFHGESTNPMTGDITKNRGVVSRKGNSEVMEFYEIRGDQEVKTMEIVYTKK
ncbi:MAG: DUF1579 domain-containing protein [Thermoanaerobaculia bacterium]|nr:DUF1579 domain-containing protein [Thermoanaerobaculia bacterium]